MTLALVIAAFATVVLAAIVVRLRARAHRGKIAESRLAAIVESSDDAIVGKNLDGIITSWNQGAARLFGYPASEAIGQSIKILIPPDRLDEEAALLAQIRAGRRVPPFETVRVRKGGGRVPVSLTVSPIREPSGRIIGASKIARDISERLQTEQRLAFLAEVSEVLTSSLDYEQTLERAVHLALPRLGDYCSVFVLNEHGRLRHAASGHVVPEKEPLVRALVTRLVDESVANGVESFASEIVKTGVRRVMAHEELVRRVAEVSRTPQAAGLQREFVDLVRQWSPYAYLGTPLVVRGRVGGAISFGTTEQESRREYTAADADLADEFARRVSLAVENARLFRQADELNRLKDEFLATLSHELRTPLGAVLGWTRMLSSGQLAPERTAHAVAAIERSAQAQSKIVEDILDLARGTAGNLRLDMKPIDLSVVAQRGVEAIAPAAAAKQIRIDVRAPSETPIVGDAARLQQVMWNLLSNAVKFTPTGGAVVVETARADGFAELRVSDSGMGIRPEFLPYVFDKFRQADASPTRRHGGLGLGLAIVRHIVELHGGRVDARSEGEGKGATFVVRLPILGSDLDFSISSDAHRKTEI